MGEETKVTTQIYFISDSGDDNILCSKDCKAIEDFIYSRWALAKRARMFNPISNVIKVVEVVKEVSLSPEYLQKRFDVEFGEQERQKRESSNGNCLKQLKLDTWNLKKK